MYVRKFEADSLEEALSEIKRELGPDAIILKTSTNKGLKGAFAKKRIEITAAISEKSYTKKAKVDTVLNEEQKDKFYSNKASYISDMIEGNAPKANTKSGYGKVALNKSVNSVQRFDPPMVNNQTAATTSSLDHFLSDETNTERKTINAEKSFDDFLDDDNFNSAMDDEEEVVIPEVKRPVVNATPAPRISARYESNSQVDQELERVMDLQKNKIDELEKKLFELTRNVESINRPESRGIQELISILRSLDIEDSYIQRIVRKAHFELNGQDKEDSEIVFDFALREMIQEINVKMPLFSSVDNSEKKTVTLLISDTSSGQSSMIRKISSLQKDSVIVRNRSESEFKSSGNFTEKFFNIETKNCKTVSEIVAAARTSIDNKNNVFIDYKVATTEVNEVKKFIDGLRRSFENVEVLVCLSAINTELYNRKVLNKYSKLSDGIVITHLDQCLNFGSLFNLAIDFNSLPFKFFGTGTIVPDDFEAATAERILAGIFQL